MTNKTSFSCGEVLDIAHVTALHSRLQKSLQKASVIELKADKVSKTDTAGLQLILSLISEVKLVGGEVIWKKPSQMLIDAASLLGLQQQLGLS